MVRSTWSRWARQAVVHLQQDKVFALFQISYQLVRPILNNKNDM